MDTLLLSRLQFAAATIFHFLFVPLTLGLSVLIAIMETRFVRTGDEDYKRMAKFWGKLFLINFAVGVVTGITLEFQFGTNWSRYSQFVGDIFGSLLAIEASVAFFLESTFIAVWFFGWKRLSPKMHLLTIWLVAIASNLSAVWILIANSWMQKPVGYVLRNGRAELDDFVAVVTSPFAIQMFLHTAGAAYIVAGFFVMGISAWHLLRKHEVEFFTKSFRLALGWSLVFSILLIVQGHLHGVEIVSAQPAKVAAMEALWDTQTHAPIHMFLVPDEANERNRFEFIEVPSALSMLAYHFPRAQVKGLKEFPADERPPVLISFFSFRIMVALGLLFGLLTVTGWLLRNRLDQHPWYYKIMVFAIPLPYLACELGWTLAEVGRQPWIVYGIMKTSDGVSPIEPLQVMISLIAFVLLYSFLGAVAIYLMFHYARKGPLPQPVAPDKPAKKRQ